MVSKKGGDFSYIISSLCFIAAQIAQIIRPIKAGNADALSLPFICLIITGFLLRIPYFMVYEAPKGEPLRFKILLWFAIMGVKIYFMELEKDKYCFLDPDEYEPL